jgi:hypothetical protein
MSAAFRVNYVTVDGLDWESADRFQKTAADQHSQKEAAEDYDADPENWARRVGVAMEIVQLGINTVGREINPRKG